MSSARNFTKEQRLSARVRAIADEILETEAAAKARDKAIEEQNRKAAKGGRS